MKQLSERQEACLEAIERLAKEKGYPPSIRELCDELGGIGTNAVFNHLLALEKKGYIRRDPAIARSIQVLQANEA
jgi:repressor LexA